MAIDKDESVKSESFNVTKKGSLGLLAFGDIGLREWRKVKNNVEKSKVITDEER
ncbi:hypothetical protein [Winogradskyella psychrotolerans]|uniref:hypothetical protein n=1 Tax=Winogradskyella psychrotolerans TaxID=1344585 RepID=UPI001C06658C|nr:hypothetical protein [Winogradskyella psychrotolerans]MBU2929195.1 hypothetical protein [Winogradskyella psychrotolerans]